MPPDGLRPLALAALGRLLEVAAEFHFTEDALALHFLLQSAQSLVDIIVADMDVHGRFDLLSKAPVNQ